MNSLRLKLGKKITENYIFIAVLMSLLSLLFAFAFCDIKYNISDDFIIDAVLSGAYTGDLNPHMMFGNTILGYILVFFYSVTKGVSCYFVYLILCAFIAVATVNYVCLKNLSFKKGIIIVAVNSFVFSNDLFITPSFTHSASAIILAGGMLLVDCLWDSKLIKRNKVISVVISVAMILMGSLLRFSCVYLTAPFVVTMFVIRLIQNFKITDVRRIIYRLLFCGVVLLFAFSLEYIGKCITKSDPNYDEYYRIDEIRSEIVDVPYLSLDQFKEVNDNLTDIDYLTLYSWDFADSNVYSEEVLESLANRISDYYSKGGIYFQRVINGLSNSYSLVYPTSLFTLACILFMIFYDKKSLKYVLISMITLLLMTCLFNAIGRMPYRIEIGLIYGFFICLIFSFQSSDCKSESMERLMYFLLLISVCIFQFTVYFTNNIDKKLSDDEYLLAVDEVFDASSEWKLKKYTYDIYDRDLYANFFEHVENDDEHYYIFSFYETIQSVFYHFKPYERIPASYFCDNYDYLGGCTMFYPEHYSSLEANGINPKSVYEDLIDGNIYVVDSEDYIKVKLLYLRKYYDANVQVELIDEIDNMPIWHFYTEADVAN